MKLPFLVVLQIDVNLHLMVPVSPGDSGPTERKYIPCAGSEAKHCGQLSWAYVIWAQTKWNLSKGTVLAGSVFVIRRSSFHWRLRYPVGFLCKSDTETSPVVRDGGGHGQGPKLAWVASPPNSPVFANFLIPLHISPLFLPHNLSPHFNLISLNWILKDFISPKQYLGPNFYCSLSQSHKVCIHLFHINHRDTMGAVSLQKEDLHISIALCFWTSVMVFFYVIKHNRHYFQVGASLFTKMKWQRYENDLANIESFLITSKCQFVLSSYPDFIDGCDKTGEIYVLHLCELTWAQQSVISPILNSWLESSVMLPWKRLQEKASYGVENAQWALPMSIPGSHRTKTWFFWSWPHFKWATCS